MTIRHWHYRAFLPAFEDSQPYMKAKRAGSGQSGKNLRCFIRASKANCDKALELLAGYRSFPPVGPNSLSLKRFQPGLLPLVADLLGLGRVLLRRGTSGPIMVHCSSVRSEGYFFRDCSSCCKIAYSPAKVTCANYRINWLLCQEIFSDSLSVITPVALAISAPGSGRPWPMSKRAIASSSGNWIGSGAPCRTCSRS